MKYCTKCGTELTPGADICGGCGCPVPGAAQAVKSKMRVPGLGLILGMFAVVIALCVVSLVKAPKAQPIPTTHISFGNFTTDGFTIDDPRKAQLELNLLRIEFENEHDRLIRLPSDPSVKIGNLEISGMLTYKSEYQTRFNDFAEEVADWANAEIRRSNDKLWAIGSTSFFFIVIAAAVIMDRKGTKVGKENG